jgi:hypothetical protein
MFGSIISLILPGITSIFDKYLTNEADKAKATQEITQQLLTNEAAITDAAKDVIVAEAESDSPLAKNWRPILMYLLMLMLIWITAVAPIFGLVDVTLKSLQGVPDNLWNMLMVGLGGYMFSRTGEKIVKTLKGK